MLQESTRNGFRVKFSQSFQSHVGFELCRSALSFESRIVFSSQANSFRCLLMHSEKQFCLQRLVAICAVLFSATASTKNDKNWAINHEIFHVLFSQTTCQQSTHKFKP
jgi:hypothetical protein